MFLKYLRITHHRYECQKTGTDILSDTGGVDVAFTRQVDEFIEQYRPALDALAKALPQGSRIENPILEKPDKN